ncbi:MAG: sterol desaturase family protein [Acidobacteria bacterium]|nr:sterol desaturase family protein [Acidobacteriota bacterium]
MSAISEVQKGQNTGQASQSDIPFGVYRRQQAAISRGRLYPVTVFYSAYAMIVLFFALRSAHPWVAASFYAAGIPVWTLVEYIFHRNILHGHFASGKGIIRRFLHERLDPLHWEHHKHPFDGLHVNGELRDLLPLFVVAAPVSFIWPIYTAPVLLAGTVQCYVLEEWIHHSVHFYNFRNPYFRYIKRFHYYHHSPKGMNLGFGLTNGFWDIIFKTRYPAPVRQVLYRRKRTASLKMKSGDSPNAPSEVQA